MSLIKFHKKPETEPLNKPVSEKEQKAIEAAARARNAARAMMATKEFKEMREGLAVAQDRAMDALFKIANEEFDPNIFSIRVRKVLHDVEFLRALELSVIGQAGEK